MRRSRRSTSAPAAPGSARHPSASQIVQSGSAITAVRPRARRPCGGRAPADRRGPARARGSVARTATTSTGASGRANPLLALVLGVERIDVGHRELVRLAGVAAVDRRHHLGSRHARSSDRGDVGHGGEVVVERGQCRRGAVGCARPLAGAGRSAARRRTAPRPGRARSPPACPWPRPASRRAARRHRRRRPAPDPQGRRPARPTPHARPVPCWRRPRASTPSALTPARSSAAVAASRVEPQRRRSWRRRGCVRRRRSASVTVGSVPPRP